MYMLTFSVVNIRERFVKIPMALLTIALIGGILLAARFTVPAALWLALIALSVIASLWRREIAVAAIFALGGALYQIMSFEMLPQGQQLRLVVQIADQGIDYGKYSTYAADVLMCNGERCRAKVRITADSLLCPNQGDVIETLSAIRPFTPQGGGYAQSMYRRGYSGRVTIGGYKIVSYAPAQRQTLHGWAVERLESLLPPSLGRDVAISVTLGTRAISGSELSKHYSVSGASHLLAVSGLHVALVFVLINILLLPVLLLWRGNLIRAVVAVAMIWLYVALCGYPASAVRAAIMFSVLQLSYLAKSRHLPENSLFLTAFIMLAADPYMLFELSFQLSFVAVAAILFVAKPIIGMINYRGVGRGIVDGVVISTACVVATMPLISHSFGVISLLSIVVTPLALLTSQIMIVCNLAALVLPLPAAQIVAHSAAWCGEVQNWVVELFAGMGVGYANLQIDTATLALSYVVMILLTLLSFGFRWRTTTEGVVPR